MAQLCEGPFGFEDGHVVSYHADSEGLRLTFEFWNEQRRTFIFKGLVGVVDHGAIGLTISGTRAASHSELLSRAVARHFEKRAPQSRLMHFEFLDLDEAPVLQIVAEECVLD